jgi:cell division protein FtsB
MPSTPDAADRRNLRLIIFALIGLCLLFVVGYVQRLAAKEAVEAQVIALQAKIGEAERRTAILQDQLADINSPAYVAKVARDDLGLVQAADVPIVVLDPPATATPAAGAETASDEGAPAETANWRLWWELVVPPAQTSRR